MRRGLRAVDRGPRADPGRLVERVPLDLESVLGRVHFDLEGRPGQATRNSPQGLRREFEASARGVETVVADLEFRCRDHPRRPTTELSAAVRLHDSENDRSVGGPLRERGSRPFRAPQESLLELDPVLEPRRAVVDRDREPHLPNDPLRDRAAAPYTPAVPRVDPVTAFVELVLVRFGELELVQVHEVDADLVERHEQTAELRLLFGEHGDLYAALDPPGGRRFEHGAIRSAGARERTPEVVGNVEPELVETGARQPPELLRVRFMGVEMDVVLGPEFRLQQSDVMLDPVDDPEGVAPGDPGAAGSDRARLGDHVRVRLDAAFVRVRHIELVAIRRDRAVKAAESADAGDEEDHLAALLALGAGWGEVPPIARRHRKQVEAVRLHGGSTDAPLSVKRVPRRASERRRALPVVAGRHQVRPRDAQGADSNPPPLWAPPTSEVLARWRCNRARWHTTARAPSFPPTAACSRSSTPFRRSRWAGPRSR